MRFGEDYEELFFSSGRGILANCGIVGLGPDGRLYGGYDNPLSNNLTNVERTELADYMIARWTKFKEMK